MRNKLLFGLVMFFSALSIKSAFSLPMDWNGVFGTDSHLLSHTCLTSDAIGLADKPLDSRTGTQGIRNGDCNSSFQTYVLRLNPNIIVNDAVTLKGELSSGYSRGGFAGSDATQTANQSPSNAHFFNTPAQRSALNVNQMYMEIYADTALIKMGRFSKHYGLGIIFDNGADAWDRFLSTYDGIEAEMKIGNFSLTPHFAKISSQAASGTQDVREVGLVAKYDNKNKDLIASILYAKRSSEPQNSFYSTNPATVASQAKEVTLIGPYFSKKWNKLKLAVEATLQSGNFGTIDPDAGTTKIDARAMIADLKYDLNPKWDVGMTAGQVDGDSANTSKFEGMYLHPNFKIAELMFAYNYNAFTELGKSVFDYSLNNIQFARIYGNYKTDKWTWKSAFIFANAAETAKAGKRSWHHQENYAFNGAENQADQYGWELDFGFDYRWNPNVILSGYYGYWSVGDYFAFSNSATKISTANVYGGGLKASLEF